MINNVKNIQKLVDVILQIIERLRKYIDDNNEYQTIHQDDKEKYEEIMRYSDLEEHDHSRLAIENEIQDIIRKSKGK